MFFLPFSFTCTILFIPDLSLPWRWNVIIPTAQQLILEDLKSVERLTALINETEISPFWRNFDHWLHWKLSKWQLPVQPLMKISLKWWYLCHSNDQALSVMTYSFQNIMSIHVFRLLYWYFCISLYISCFAVSVYTLDHCLILWWINTVNLSVVVSTELLHEHLVDKYWKLPWKIKSCQTHFCSKQKHVDSTKPPSPPLTTTITVKSLI